MNKHFADELLAKVKADYDAIADDFSATRAAPWTELHALADMIPNGSRVLDIGCGNGRIYQILRDKAIDYEGLDASPNLIAHARRLNADVLARFSVGSMLALPFPDASFDVALAIASLHHVPSAAYRLRALGEASRVLKPGGLLLMTNWNLWCLHYFRRHLWRFAAAAAGSLVGRSDFGDVFLPWGRPAKVRRYYHSFRPGELRRLCGRAGFELVDQYYVLRGERTPWWRGENLVTIAKKISTGDCPLWIDEKT